MLNAVRTKGLRSTTSATKALIAATSTASSQPNRMTDARMKTNASETVLRSSSSSGTGFELGEQGEREEEQDGEALGEPRGMESDADHRPDHDRDRERQSARDQGTQPGRIAGGDVC